MAADTEGVVGLVEVSSAENEFGLPVALESSAGHNVEHSISTVAKLGAVAATIHLQVGDILGIELRAEVRGDVGVRDGNAIDEPTGLVPSADVKLIMSEVCARDVIGNHGQAIGAGSARGAGDIGAADECGGRGGICGRRLRSSGDRDGFLDEEFELVVQDGLAAGFDHSCLRHLREAGAGDSDGVLA